MTTVRGKPLCPAGGCVFKHRNGGERASEFIFGDMQSSVSSQVCAILNFLSVLVVRNLGAEPTDTFNNYITVI